MASPSSDPVKVIAIRRSMELNPRRLVLLIIMELSRSVLFEIYFPKEGARGCRPLGGEEEKEGDGDQNFEGIH